MPFGKEPFTGKTKRGRPRKLKQSGLFGSGKRKNAELFRTCKRCHKKGSHSHGGNHVWGF